MSSAWISIPPFAEPGQLHAFADREEQLASLYFPLVQAGNAVRRGQPEVRHRHVVHGYMGAGKSALILQALGMVRGDGLDPKGQRLRLPAAGLPEPLDRQRWILLRVSGKHVANLDALADSLSSMIRKEEAADSKERKGGVEDAFLSAFESIYDQVDQTAPLTLDLPILSHLFQRDDIKLYQGVRKALQDLATEIQKIQQYRGGTEKRSRAETRSAALSADASGKVSAGRGVGSGDNKVGGEATAGLSYKHQSNYKDEYLVEGQWRLSATRLVELLNRFFTATNKARLPTILVLDDFDEAASSVGPSYQDRFRALSAILGTFNQLRPTSLILALRSEYMHEDIRRQFPHQTPVPPMSCDAARDAVDAWLDVLPGLTEGDRVDVTSAALRILKHFPANKGVILPFRFLPVVQWLATSPAHPLREDRDLLEHYVRQQYHPHEAEALLRVARDMPLEDIDRCAATQPLDPTSYGISEREREVLSKAGLLRPAHAGDPQELSVILDPLIAYVRVMNP